MGSELVLAAEAGLRATGVEPLGSEDDQWLVAFQIGADVNLDDERALGGSVLLEPSSSGRQGIMLRYRHGFAPETVGLLVAGPLRAFRTHRPPGYDSPFRGEWTYGFTAETGFDHRGSYGLQLRVETLPDFQGGTHTAVYFGANMESWPAVIASAAGFAACLYRGVSPST